MGRKQVYCPVCGGSGLSTVEGRSECWKCGGTCSIWVDEPDQPRSAPNPPPSKPHHAAQSKKSDSLTPQQFVAIIGLIGGGILAYKAVPDNVIAVVVGAGIGAGLGAWLYKVVIGLAIVAVIVWVLVQMNDAESSPVPTHISVAGALPQLVPWS